MHASAGLIRRSLAFWVYIANFACERWKTRSLACVIGAVGAAWRRRGIESTPATSSMGR
jgi:hypothetical protein